MSSSSSSPAPARRADRTYLVILLALALCAAVARIYIGIRQYIEYDGWIHIFIARQSSWYNFARDIRDNAHPPLFFLLLKGVSLLGHHRLVYRSISILSGIAAVLLVAKISRRITSGKSSALLATAAFGLSLSAVIISCEVRSYMLMVMFTLLAFHAFLEICALSGKMRDSILYALATSCAILTHYSAAFFLLASMAAPMLVAAVNADYRRKLAKELGARPEPWLAAFVPPSAVLAIAWLVHIRFWSAPMNHLPEFYFNPPTETLWTFIQRSTLATFNLFSPVPIQDRAELVVIAVGLFLIGAVALTAAWPVTRRISHAVPVAFFTALVVVFAAAGVARRYPLGGAMRHQFLLFPFAILALFSVYALLIDRLPWKGARAAATLLVCVVIIANIRTGIAGFPYHGDELGTSEITQFRRTVPHPQTVYADEFSTIFFFTHYQDWEWKFIGYDPRDRLAERYELRKGSVTMQFLRAKYRWNLDPADADVYRSMRHTLDFSPPGPIALFFMEQAPAGKPPAMIETAVRGAASGASLTVERLLVDGENVYGAFEASR